MAARFGFFSPECRAKTIGPPKRVDIGLVIKLSTLRQIGQAFIEIRGFEQGGGALAGRGRQNGRIHVNEAILSQPFMDRSNDCSAHAQNGPLALHADPKMAIFQSEFDAMFLEPHRVIIRSHLDYFQIGDAHFVSAWDARRALVGAHFTCNNHR